MDPNLYIRFLQILAQSRLLSEHHTPPSPVTVTNPRLNQCKLVKHFSPPAWRQRWKLCLLCGSPDHSISTCSLFHQALVKKSNIPFEPVSAPEPIKALDGHHLGVISHYHCRFLATNMKPFNPLLYHHHITLFFSVFPGSRHKFPELLLPLQLPQVCNHLRNDLFHPQILQTLLMFVQCIATYSRF